MEKPTTQRSSALDTLRGIAVLLVLVRHVQLPGGLSAWLDVPLRAIQRGGWAGVDLFFVLSGYLVSGLLFSAWKKDGQLRVGRFLIRRGFKIYPAFYVMLIAVLAWRWPGWSYALSEGLFVQNYGPAIFPHTWSLAVEEHFYLALPLVLWLAHGKKERPFAALPVIVPGVAIVCLALRIATAWDSDIATRANYAPTHLRCDALFFGVLLSWLSHFHRAALDAFTAKHRRAFVALGVLGVAPAFVFGLGPTWFLHTAGFTALYLAAGCWLLLAVRHGWSARPLAGIGFYSYSIYLWHIPVQRILLDGHCRDWFPRDGFERPVIYLVATITFGVLAAWLVELPFLKLRDRLFPSRAAGANMIGASIAEVPAMSAVSSLSH